MKYIFLMLLISFAFPLSKIQAQATMNSNRTLAVEIKFGTAENQTLLLYKQTFVHNLTSVSLDEKKSKQNSTSNLPVTLSTLRATTYSRELKGDTILSEKMDTIFGFKKFNPSTIAFLGIPFKGFTAFQPQTDSAGLIENTVLVYRLKTL